MKPRMNYYQAAPDTIKALVALEEQIQASGLDGPYTVLLDLRTQFGFTLPRLVIDADQMSADGTRKFLFRLADGQGIETVAIPEGKRVTLCVSSQAGCA